MNVHENQMHLYRAVFQTTYGTSRPVLVRRTVSARGHVFVGIGMECLDGPNGPNGPLGHNVSKSCLVLRIAGDIACVEALSSRTKSGRLKNPLGLPEGAKHMHAWVQIACAVGRRFGCSTMQLADAANVTVADGTTAFLSACTLLKSACFVYEKYGFKVVKDWKAERDAVLAALEKPPGAYAAAVKHRKVALILRHSATWPDALAEMERVCAASTVFVLSNMLDDLFEAMVGTAKPQFWFTRSLRGPKAASAASAAIQSWDALDEKPDWLGRYSERWMDVY